MLIYSNGGRQKADTFPGRLHSRSEPRPNLVAKTPIQQVLARVFLCWPPMSVCGKNVDTLRACKRSNRDFLRLHSLFSSLPLYYAGSTKVPPRVFGPLGPKTLRGQLPERPVLYKPLGWYHQVFPQEVYTLHIQLVSYLSIQPHLNSSLLFFDRIFPALRFVRSLLISQVRILY